MIITTANHVSLLPAWFIFIKKTYFLKYIYFPFKLMFEEFITFILHKYFAVSCVYFVFFPSVYVCICLLCLFCICPMCLCLYLSPLFIFVFVPCVYVCICLLGLSLIRSLTFGRRVYNTTFLFFALAHIGYIAM